MRTAKIRPDLRLQNDQPITVEKESKKILIIITIPRE